VAVATIIPAEDWPPYRWLWTHLVLARDPDTGEATPYTHGMRRHALATAAALLLLLGVIVAWQTRSRWRAVLAFGLGALSGHVFW
jgi:hypothetical protein